MLRMRTGSSRSIPLPRNSDLIAFARTWSRRSLDSDWYAVRPSTAVPKMRMASIMSSRFAAAVAGTMPRAPKAMIAAATRGRVASSLRSSSGVGLLLTKSVIAGGSTSTRVRINDGCRWASRRARRAPYEWPTMCTGSSQSRSMISCRSSSCWLIA